MAYASLFCRRNIFLDTWDVDKLVKGEGKYQLEIVKQNDKRGNSRRKWRNIFAFTIK